MLEGERGVVVGGPRLASRNLRVLVEAFWFSPLLATYAELGLGNGSEVGRSRKKKRV